MRNIPNYEIIKEPKGFIKALQVFLAIFAFACAAAYRGEVKITQSVIVIVNATAPTPATKTHMASAKFQYPFDAITMSQMYPKNGVTEIEEVNLGIDESGSSHFFMVIGVFCFMYSLGCLIYYVWFEADRPAGTTLPTTSVLSPPVIDFLIGSFWAFFWFCAACAFASAVHRVKEGTDMDRITTTFKCAVVGVTCTAVKAAKYANLTVAILMGFLNCFVWAGNMWFLWKETPWHKGNQSQIPATVQSPPPPQQTQQTPAGAI